MKDRIFKGVKNEMDERITMNRKRKPLIERLKEFSGDDEPVINRGKLRKIKEKFDEPKTLVDEGKDGWGDDLEVDI